MKIVLASIVSMGAAFGATAAHAQDASAMSCEALWHARNAIYARKGHCFETDRGRDAFGPGCRPPYGRLNASEAARVRVYQSWERRRGC